MSTARSWNWRTTAGEARAMTQDQIARFARTAVRLRPAQVAHRARLRTQRHLLNRWPQACQRFLAGPDPRSACGWPETFTPVDSRTPEIWADPRDLAAGRIALLGVERDLGDPADWTQAGAPLLWRFHLHYWDWAWGLAKMAHPSEARSRFAMLWRSWMRVCSVGEGDGWLPYPAALRAWAWCAQYQYLAAGTEIEVDFVRELAAHAGFLRRHLELDIGGNHLIKDLKALIGLAVFFADPESLRSALDKLMRQIDVQVLPDGGHYERSPSYHCQVLADLIDVAGLVEAAGFERSAELTGAIARMRRWLGLVLLPDGRVPLLNDGYPVPSSLIAVLAPVRPETDSVLLADSGLAVVARGPWHVLADVGKPCPDDLPGHAHADTLSCLISVAGAPLVIDTGTSTYALGDRRQYERSTAAHNTLEIDGADSTEVWGVFRAGRRARVRAVSAWESEEGAGISGTHDGYRWLPGRPAHRRAWSLSAAELLIDDLVSGQGRHTIVSRWQLAPGIRVRGGSDGFVLAVAGRAVTVEIGADVPLDVGTQNRAVALGFGRTTLAPVLTCRVERALPVRIRTRWRLAEGTQNGANS